MGLFPFAASDVLRNRRRTISAILGVFLAVTFVSGTFIAVDSSARATLDAALAGIPGDFSLYVQVRDGAAFDYTLLRTALLDSAGVIDASLYRFLPVYEVRNVDNVTWSTTVLGIDPGHLPSSLRQAEIMGSSDLTLGSIGLTRGLASGLGIGLGDPVILVATHYNETFDLVRTETTLNATAILDLRRDSSGGIFSYPYFQSFGLVHLRDADEVLRRLNATETYFQISGEVWIDRTSYVNPYDLEGTERSLARIQRRLEAIVGPGNFVSNNLIDRLRTFQAQLSGQRLLYLVLSAPVLLLGVYLGAVGVDLSHAERRRELAVLRTRGATKGQVVGFLIVEAIVGGLIAAILGLAAGIGLSRLLLGAVATASTDPGYEAFALTTDTVIAVALLSILLMILVSYRSARRTATLPIIETLRYYAKGETRIQYRPKVDIALVTIGVADYALVWYSRGQPFSLLMFLLGVLPFLLLPVVPIMLVVGGTRLLTRMTARVYDLFARASKPFTKDLYYVIRRNLQRNPRRSSNVAIIIALGLAFGLFTFTIVASQQGFEERQIRARVGADMSVDPADVNDATFATNLSSIDGIAGVAAVVQLTSVTALYCCPNAYALDPASYFAVAQPEWWYFLDGGATAARAVVETPGQILVSRSFYNDAFLEVGDVLRMSKSTYSDQGNFTGTIELNVTVGGVVRYLPGVGFGYGEPAIYGSSQTFQSFLAAQESDYYRASPRYLVDLVPGADWRAVKADILELTPFVVVTQEEIERFSANPFFLAIRGFVSMETAFIVVILTVGLGLVLYAASLERDVEFAGMIARGASGWQTATVLMGEAFVIMLVGLAVGAGVGLATSYFTTQLFFVGPPGFGEPPVPFLFVFPWEAAALVGLGCAAMMLAALLVSARIARLNVAKVLKMRGG
jgi:putative ABC transport system permease protein